MLVRHVVGRINEGVSSNVEVASIRIVHQDMGSGFVSVYDVRNKPAGLSKRFEFQLSMSAGPPALIALLRGTGRLMNKEKSSACQSVLHSTKMETG